MKLTLAINTYIMPVENEDIYLLFETCRRNDMNPADTQDFICTTWEEHSTTLKTINQTKSTEAS